MAVCGAMPSLFVTLQGDDDDPTHCLASAADPEANDCVILPRLPTAADPPSSDRAIAESCDSEATSLTPTRAQSPTPTPSVASNDDSIEEVEINDTPRTNLEGRIIIPRPRRHELLARESARVKEGDLGAEKENKRPAQADSGIGSIDQEQVREVDGMSDALVDEQGFTRGHSFQLVTGSL